jgi:hypothetical protein
MSAGRVILKVKGKYYHRYSGGDSFDVHAVAPGEYSSGYFKDNGGAYLSLYNEMGAYQGRIHAGKLKASRINGAWLWEADAPRREKEETGTKASVLEHLRTARRALREQKPAGSQKNKKGKLEL